MRSFFRNCHTQWIRWSQARKAASQPKRVRPRGLLGVEELENRLVPTDLLVTSISNMGPGSLRQAILDANAHAGPDSISFDARLQNRAIQLTEQIQITGDLTIQGRATNVTIA